MKIKSFVGRYGVLVLSMFTISLGALVFASTYGKKIMNDEGMMVADLEPASGEETVKPAMDALTNVGEEIKPGDPVVAIIDQVKIKRSEIFAMIDQLSGPQQVVPKQVVFPVVLDQYVNGKIVEIKAEKADVSATDLYQERLKEAKEQIARSVYIEQQIDAKITDEALKAAYDTYVTEQSKIEELKASHILLETEEEALAVIKSLEEGGDFASIAKEKSTGPSGVNGGDLGYFKQGDMVPEFEAAAFEMKKDEFSKAPVKTQFGYHVILVSDRRAVPVDSFEAKKAELEANLRNQTLQALLGEWRKDTAVQLFNINGEEIKESKAE